MIEERENMFRVNTRISVEANEWLDRKSKKTGVPKSALINLAIEQYILQNRSVDALELSQGTLKELYDKLTRLELELIPKPKV